MPEPRINPQFPVWASDNLSPPIVQPPIHPCALAVFVYGFVPGATVRVYANSSELVGQDEPVVGFATLKVSLPLSLGEAITATQAVGPIVSAHSHEPVVVSPYPRLRRPVVGPDLYACGRVVPAANLAPSTHVEVWDDDTGEVIGTGETTNYPRIAGVLEELGYSGTVGLEAYASEDDELALERFRSAFTTRSAVGQVAGT